MALSRREKAEQHSRSGCCDIETFFGFIKNKEDAMLIVEACVNGQLQATPRCQHNKLKYRSGSVVVYSQNLSDKNSIRWRDGGSWSTSKLSEGFLLYREVEAFGVSRRMEKCALFKAGSVKPDCQLVPDGLAKRTICVTGSDGNRYRVISYFYPLEVEGYFKQTKRVVLQRPSQLPEFRHLKVSLNVSAAKAESNYSSKSPDSPEQISSPIFVPAEIPAVITTNSTTQEGIPQQRNSSLTNLIIGTELDQCSCGGLTPFNMLFVNTFDRNWMNQQPVYLAPIKIPHSHRHSP
ncbi:hypothetical protein HK100_008236 [Physocladia obscura]|uniref:Uncharacterized protein n=1 Tax=Physocladia obscura TaxID=109957 RepID=A0AAD5X6H3_9FUNG|nr:hypothetical protein HK100_008236 [Physocladia obscura]